MRSFDGICYNDKGQLLDVYLPDSQAKATFVFFHGGGLEEGSRKGFDVFIDHLVKHGVAVISADYRMYPTAHYPDFIEDSADAVAWAFSNAKQYDLSEKIYVGGSSAGGYISMMLCFDDRYLGKHGIAPTDIAGYVHNAGQPTAHFNVLREKGIDTRRIIVDETAPLYYIGLAKSYSPMLFLVSDNDIHGRYEQTMLVLATLKHFGYDFVKIDHKVLHGWHCEHDCKRDDRGDSVFGKLILDFINNH